MAYVGGNIFFALWRAGLGCSSEQRREAFTCYARATEDQHAQSVGLRSSAFVIVAILAALTALAASILGFLDTRTVALVALIIATGACFVAVAYFIYFIVSDRQQVK